MTKTATFISTKTSASGAEQRLYRVYPPAQYNDFGPDEQQTDYVIVSAVYVPMSGPETYIFAANEEGEVIDWIELSGSFRGDYDHERALKQAGYEVVSGVEH